MSIDGGERLLRGWKVGVPSGATPPVALAASLLGGFGAAVRTGAPCGDDVLTVETPGRRSGTASLGGWTGERALHDALGGRGRHDLVPRGDVLTTFTALVLAADAVAAPEAPRVVRCAGLVDELLAGLVPGPGGPELVRCGDGWVLARWRTPDERELFHAIVGQPHTRAADLVVDEARSARLLVAVVRAATKPPSDGLGAGMLDGCPPPPGPLRIVDWTVLWAGPWAARELSRAGAAVERIEHPRRRDGLLGWPDGQAWWQELNGGKRLTLLDVRERGDLARMRELLATSQILLTSMTPRALRALGFDDAWRAAHTPGLLHVELVAFDEPNADVPGLGEHAAGEAGLLWRDADGPATPYPWADALLGAAALCVCRIWSRSAERRGGRIRLSLETAARLASGGAAALDVRTSAVHTHIPTG